MQPIDLVMQEKTKTLIESSFLALSPLTKIKDALESMVEKQASCVLVIEDQKLLGIFTERDVVKMTVNQSLIENLKIGELMTTKIITLKVSDTQNIFSLSRLFRKQVIRHLPILDEQNQVVGVITPQSLRNVMKPEHLLRYIRVEEVINSKVISGLPSDSIYTLAQKMALHRVSCIVIINRLNSFPIGIVTERDLVRFHQLELDFAQVSAQSVMSQPLFTVRPQESLWRVHETMQKLQVRRLVITLPTGELAGIVTQTQMLKILDPSEMYQVMQQMQEIIDQQTSELHKLNQELQIKNKKLLHLSTVDEVTQVVNRRRLNEFLNCEWQRLSSLGKPLSLIMCDLDHFKKYNDAYGHLNGDKCLQKVAQTIREVTRKNSDLIARYGGEEFVVVLPNTNQNVAERIAKTILTQIQNLKIPHAPSNLLKYVTVSLGVATMQPDPTNSPETLLKYADQLLYQSKQRGRNTYSIEFIATSDVN